MGTTGKPKHDRGTQLHAVAVRLQPDLGRFRMKRVFSKRDANHADLTKRFEELGCTVQDLSNAGVAGWPDVVVGCIGRNHLVEFKNPETAYGRAGLNRNQREFAQRWRGGQMFAVSTPEEVDVLVQNWRRAA